MIPDTAASLLSLLALVAPGIVFQLRRERRRPQLTQTAFREASIVALTSFVFTVLALVLLVPVTKVWPSFADVDAWLLTPGPYAAENPYEVGRFLLAVVAVASALAVAAEWATGRDWRGQIVNESIWFTVFRRDLPPGAARVWVWVTTVDGSQFKGYLRTYSVGESLEDRELALGGSPLRKLEPKGDPIEGWVDLGPFDAVILQGSMIRHLVVEYLDEFDQPLRAIKPTRNKGFSKERSQPTAEPAPSPPLSALAHAR